VRGVRNHIFTDLKIVSGNFVNVAGEVEIEEERDRAISAPRIVANRGISFSAGGRIGCEYGAIRIQFIVAPPIIAPEVRINIGVDRFQSSSLSSDIGTFLRSLHRRLTEKRIE